MDEIESLNNFYSRVNFDAFSKSCQIAMFKHNIVKFLQNVWKISSVDYHCLCADDFLVRIDIFSSDFANNSDDYIFSIIQLTIFYWQINCSPFTPNSWATSEEDLRQIFFVKSQRTALNPHDCCDLTSFSFSYYFCFLYKSSRSHRSSLFWWRNVQKYDLAC